MHDPRVASGLRSPAGVEDSAERATLFFTDNQGEWCGASKLSHLEYGDYHGHPWGIDSSDLPEWEFPHPGENPDGILMPEAAKVVPRFKMPAVWFPRDKMGRSPAGMVWDRSHGKFGPFAGQCFVADQYSSEVMRVFLEVVNGHWQGVGFPFRRNLDCGIVRVAWGADDSMFCGQTNRGWGSVGNRTHGLQRLVWTGETPFEVLEMRARPDGFELVFTEPVDPETAGDAASYSMQSYTYRFHSTYGSDEVDLGEPEVSVTEVSADGRTVVLAVDALRAGYVHELHLEGVRSADGRPLLHDVGYYTLVEIPTGE